LLRTTLSIAVATLLLLGALPLAQGIAPAPLTLLSAQGRRPFPTTIVNRQEMVSIDDLASLLQVVAREDTAAGGITLSYKGRTVTVSQDQAVASTGGRLVPLPSPAVRVGRRWFVPLDVLPRALSLIYDVRIELRQPSRLVIVGNMRVPRVTVRLDSAGPPTRLSIEASPPTLITPTVETGRVVLRLDADALDLAPLPQAGGLLAQARAEGTGVVLTLSPQAGQARASRAAGDNLSRINIDVSAGGQGDLAVGPLPAPAVPGEPAPNSAVPPPVGNLVVLDPGHGGSDTGATGRSGVQEKMLTLAIAQRAKALIESRLGVRVLLTRDDDRDMTLDERTALANSRRAELFVSLHLNASFSPMMSGAEVYLLKPSQASPPGDRPDGTQLTLPTAAGGSRTVALLPWDLAQVRHREDSTLLANQFEVALRENVPMGIRPIQEAPMRVLAGLDMASVVVELAYLSNPEQEAAVQAEDFQTRAALAILQGISAYRATWRGER
jgi:N-acetylmuramoyl-L-alanine amidase